LIIKISDNRPWVVLIHGFGVTEKVWFAPLEEKTRFISFKTLLKDEKDVVPFAERCNKNLFNIACWTQDVVSTIDEASYGLKEITESIQSKNILYIAHSRGGLVARRAIQKYNLRPNALICLSTPHKGSRFADTVIKYRSFIRLCFSAIDDFLLPIEELNAKSPIIEEINANENLALENHIPHFDICGDTTAYFNIGFFNVMKSLNRFFDKRLIDEWREGYGDGFVSIGSARSPLTPIENYFKLSVNHANILIDSGVWAIVNNILQRFISSTER